jgi:ADP-heptose:LPS heptosyltransferase
VPARLVESARVRYGLDCKQTKADRLLIAINPGPNWPIKEWEASKWQMLIDKIHSEYDALIIQFGINKGDGSSDYDHLTGVKSLAARLKGEELLALIAQCDLVVSIDSGPLHLAGAVGTPAVGLFGPMNPVSILSPNSQTPALGLVSDVPCLFCHNRTPVLHWITGCPYDIACMKRLECEVVFEAVKSMLEFTRKREIKEPLARFD